jgi:hypothetical protein
MYYYQIIYTIIILNYVQIIFWDHYINYLVFQYRIKHFYDYQIIFLILDVKQTNFLLNLIEYHLNFNLIF